MTEEVKTQKRGVGTVAREAIIDGSTNEQALEAVQAEFPEAKTSLASINWYRNKLRSEGDHKILTARELKKAAKAEAEAEGAEAPATEEDDPLA